MTSLDALWLPFTPNRAFKRAPRLLVSAEGMYYRDADGNTVLDATSGLWCVNAGHCRPPIVQAIQRAAATLDYAPGFNMAHPAAFELADRLTAIAPEGLDRVFFTNSGSESVDTALKIVMAYHAARGDTRGRASWGACAAITAWASAASRWADWRTIDACSPRICCRIPMRICRPRTVSPRTSLRRVSPHTARIWPTRCTTSSPNTVVRPSPQ
jgi:hypothetical protein